MFVTLATQKVWREINMSNIGVGLKTRTFVLDEVFLFV